MNSKIADRGKLGFMVGYWKCYATDTYCVFMLKTERLVMTQDVKWPRVYYGDFLNERTYDKCIDLYPDASNASDSDDKVRNDI